MTQFSTAELQRLAREIFGRELSAEQVETYRARLPVMIRNVAVLEDWQGRLGETEPATLHRGPDDGASDDA